jgi:hypothetical protein
MLKYLGVLAVLSRYSRFYTKRIWERFGTYRCARGRNTKTGRWQTNDVASNVNDGIRV